MAGALIGALRVTLGLDSAAFEKGADAMVRRQQSLTRSFTDMGSRISSIGAGLSVGITAPLALFGKNAFAAASDAAELQSSFDTTFGAMSARMNKWAEETGNAMGRSTQEMQKAANTFGIFFNQAVDPAKAAAMSQTFAKLAQDLGSFYNVDTETAIEKLRSGLSGESEPLRDFGVFLTEASVQAKAMQMGLAGVGNELTEQEKIQARYALILEQTTKAQGDVARTSGGTANQLRAAQAAFDELQVIIGTKLLPVITPLITKVADMLNWFVQLPTPVQNVAVAVGAVGAALGPVALGFGGIVSGIGTAMPHLIKFAGFFSTTLLPVLAGVGRALVGLAVAGGPLTLFVAGATAAYLAWQNWEKIGPIVGRMVTAVKTWLVDKLGGVFTWVQQKLQAVGDGFYKLYDRVVGHSYVPDMVDGVSHHFSRLDKEMVDPAAAANDNVAEGFATMAQQVVGSLQGLANNIRSGDWMGALEGVLGLITQIKDGSGGIGSLFGGGSFDSSSIRAGANSALDSVMQSAPAFATGGSFRVGGAPGVDKNLIAFRASKGEMVDIRRPGQRMSTHQPVARVEIVENPAFASRVVGISDGVSINRVSTAQRTAARRGRQRLA